MSGSVGVSGEQSPETTRPIYLVFLNTLVTRTLMLWENGRPALQTVRGGSQLPALPGRYAVLLGIRHLPGEAVKFDQKSNP